MTRPDRTPRDPRDLADPLALAFELHGLAAWFNRRDGRFGELDAHAFAVRLRRAARAAAALAANPAVRMAAVLGAEPAIRVPDEPAPPAPPAGPVPDLLGEFLARCGRRYGPPRRLSADRLAQGGARACPAGRAGGLARGRHRAAPGAPSMSAPAVRITIAAAPGLPAATIGSIVSRALRANGYAAEDVEVAFAGPGTLSFDAVVFASNLRAAAEALDTEAASPRPAVVHAATMASVLRAVADGALDALERQP